MILRHLRQCRGPAPLVPHILAKAALALRDINQHELADIVTLLAVLATTEQIAAVRDAIFTVLAT